MVAPDAMFDFLFRSGVLAPMYVGPVSGLPTASAASAGRYAVLTDVGGNSVPGTPASYRAWLQSDGVNWHPLAGTLPLFLLAGSVATPLATKVGNGASIALFTIAPVPTLPANLFSAGGRVRFRIKGRRTAVSVAAAVDISLLLGTSGTNADSELAKVSVTNTANTDFVLSGEATIEGLTAVLGTAYLTTGGSATSAMSDKTTNVNFAAAQFLSVGVGANALAGDSFALYDFAVWFEG